MLNTITFSQQVVLNTISNYLETHRDEFEPTILTTFWRVRCCRHSLQGRTEIRAAELI